MAKFVVQRVNQDGSACRATAPWTNATEGGWTSIVEAQTHAEAATLVAKQWALNPSGPFMGWPLLLKVRGLESPESILCFSVNRVVETRYPLTAVNLPMQGT